MTDSVILFIILYVACGMTYSLFAIIQWRWDFDKTFVVSFIWLPLLIWSGAKKLWNDRGEL